jgi:hypothetical protein
VLAGLGDKGLRFGRKRRHHFLHLLGPVLPVLMQLLEARLDPGLPNVKAATNASQRLINACASGLDGSLSFSLSSSA